MIFRVSLGSVVSGILEKKRFVGKKKDIGAKVGTRAPLTTLRAKERPMGIPLSTVPR
jgi:hypothetical protein